LAICILKLSIVKQFIKSLLPFYGAWKGYSLVSLDPTVCISCPICLGENTVEQFVQTECKHVFHLPCLQAWLIQHQSCPVCRTLLPELTEFD